MSLIQGTPRCPSDGEVYSIRASDTKFGSGAGPKIRLGMTFAGPERGLLGSSRAQQEQPYGK